MLLVERGERQWLFPISRDPVGIGRSPNNHVSVEDSQLAPRHLRIIPLGEEIWAKDMGSPAGFQIRGRWLREARLRAGDEIAIGELRASLLVEETQTPPPPLAPVIVPEAPELPPTPVRRRGSLAQKKGLPAWVWIAASVGALLSLLIFWMSRSVHEEQRQQKAAAWAALENARGYLREKLPGKARESLRGIVRSDAEIEAQVRSLEKEIALQEVEAKKPSGREEGDEFYERYLLPIFKSNELLSDIRWENVAWRRCEEFLSRFPKHPLFGVVKTRRDRFAAGAKEAPATRMDELEIDVRLLTENKAPNFSMAREKTLSFIRDNMGGADDLRARELLQQLDRQAEAHFSKKIEETKKLWNEGEKEKASAILDRLVTDIGREDLAVQAKEAKAKLGP